MKLALVSPSGNDRPRLAAELEPGLLLDVPAAAALWDGKGPARRLAAWPDTIKALAEQGPDALDAVRWLVGVARQERAAGSAPGHVLLAVDDVRFHPPVPDPGKFMAVGKNYRAHLDELMAADMLREMPQEPTCFIKLASSLSPHGGKVRKPEEISTFDYEPELAFVIGRRAHGVREAEAMDHVLGITAFNDLTAREIQKREVASGTRFWTAKNMPGFGPLGPYVVTLDEAGDVDDLWIACRVNGEQRLRFNTCDQINRIPRIIEHFSRFIPLEPGDVMATGCQKGTAFGKPNAQELFLRPGDEVEVEIEGLMTLRTTII
jgi:acylpyruvate hydrolase